MLKSDNPLLRQLLDEHDLCILKNALKLEEIRPGTIVTVGRFNGRSRPVRRPFNYLFDPPLTVEIFNAPYRPITFEQATGKFTAEIISKVSGLLGDSIMPHELRSALDLAGAKTLDLELRGPRRYVIDQHEVEVQLSRSYLTAEGKALKKDRGDALYLILAAYIADGGVIGGTAEQSLVLETSLKEKLEGRVRIARVADTKIALAPVDPDQPLVFGFSAAEIIENGDGGWTLLGLDRPLTVLDHDPKDPQNKPVPAAAELFSELNDEPIAALLSD